MQKTKRSFFERLTGSIRVDPDLREDSDSDMEESGNYSNGRSQYRDDTSSIMSGSINISGEEELEVEEAELSVDLYETDNEVVVKAMIAGVKPDNMEVDIARDHITIRGNRTEESTQSEDSYYVKELYWGSFARTITLPAEIEVEEAEAVEKHGLLTIRMPKIDKERRSRVKIKSS